MKTKTQDDFDYAPTILNDGRSEFYLKEFLRYREDYTNALTELRKMGCTTKNPVLVKSFVLPCEEQKQPRANSRLWQQIDAYVKKHQSSTWVFEFVEEDEIDINDDPYDDYETLATQYNIFATIKDSKDVKKTAPYKEQVKYVQYCLDKLEESKERFWVEVRKEK